MVGAVEEERYIAMLERAGFEQVRRLAELDYFRLSSNAKTREVAGLFNAHSIALAAVKPQHAPATSVAASPTGWRRGDLRPFWLAAPSAVFAVATTWVALVGIAFWVGWWPYLGVAGLLAASAWSFLLGRRPGVCAVEMIGEARWRDRFASPAQRAGMRAAATVAVAATLYGLYMSVVAFTPA